LLRQMYLRKWHHNIIGEAEAAKDDYSHASEVPMYGLHRHSQHLLSSMRMFSIPN
jgi:hypothetical protein